ncbi:hypothetical protein BASA81_011118 [Batrachochytrium salamandrivorans]|nr:hypothetical protein BASA81_011118 [Batrachochytrium salamandrivorans]
MASKLLKSAYEVAREDRIKRNALVMQSLGLGVEEPVTTTTTAAAKPAKSKPKQEPTRQSKRVRGLGPDGQQAPVRKPLEEVEEDEEELVDLAMKQRIKRLERLHEENNSGYKNPTATYEHTWMRVRTMSDKALGTRIKVIERMAGQHCLVKMQMFAEVLVLVGKDELAALASDALDRLVAESTTV